MNMLPQEFYARKADIVAKELLGRYLCLKSPGSVNVTRARLREIAAYEGTTKTTSEGVLYEPGILSISMKFGKRLLDISTGKENLASCVTLRSADFISGKKEQRVEGPGNLTYELGIRKNTWPYYDGRKIWGNIIWIEGESIPQDIVKRKEGNSENCLGLFRF